jgi:hypothetical protein
MTILVGRARGQRAGFVALDRVEHDVEMEDWANVYRGA